MHKKNIVTASMLIATGLALGACSSSYQNNVMFARIERPLTQADVERERTAARTVGVRTAPLYAQYSDQDLRMASFAVFNCASTPAGFNSPIIYSDAALVPAGINVQNSDIVAIEMGGGAQPNGGGAHPHRILEVFPDKEVMNLEAERVGDIMLVNCNQNAYSYGHNEWRDRNKYGESANNVK